MLNERVFLGLGSNLGNKTNYICRALDLLVETPGISIESVSSFYETEPVGNENQEWFINLVAEVTTRLEPLELLEKVQEIESLLGRVRVEKWGPRTIDIDILLYGMRTVVEDKLVIPHPRLKERAFMLVPLYEVAPYLVLPSGETLKDLLSMIPKEKKVLLFKAGDAKL